MKRTVRVRCFKCGLEKKYTVDDAQPNEIELNESYNHGGDAAGPQHIVTCPGCGARNRVPDKGSKP
jgi:RNase P subunit RPR2